MKDFYLKTALLAALATGANAQSAPTINGMVQLEGMSNAGSTSALGYANFDGEFTFAGSGSSLSYGLEYDVTAIGTSGAVLGAYFVSAFVDFDNSRINVGAIKSAYSQFEPESVFAQEGYTFVALYANTAHSINDVYQFSLGGNLPLGLRYDGRFSDVSVSASVTRLAPGAVVVAAAGEYDMGNVQLGAGFELLTSAPAQNNAYLRLTGQTGSGAYLAQVSRRQFLGGGTIAELGYMHDFTDKFSAGAGLLHAFGAGSLYSAGATYDFGPAYLRATALSGFGSQLYSLSVGAEF